MAAEIRDGFIPPTEPSLEQLRSGVIADTKGQLEFSRYKQDCRKRALDCAIDECRRVGGFAPTIKDPSKLVHQEEAKPFDILAEADKYYNWLITIPQ